MRTVERHGGAEVMERQFLGFAALPEKASQPWREVLGIPPNVPPTPDLIQSHYRNLVKLHHPDMGGKEEDFQRIVQAKEAALLEIAS
jgi:DnaJ-class molecular chaperone